jgi:hypothetical protein
MVVVVVVGGGGVFLCIIIVVLGLRARGEKRERWNVCGSF